MSYNLTIDALYLGPMGTQHLYYKLSPEMPEGKAGKVGQSIHLPGGQVDEELLQRQWHHFVGGTSLPPDDGSVRVSAVIAPPSVNLPCDLRYCPIDLKRRYAEEFGAVAAIWHGGAWNIAGQTTADLSSVCIPSYRQPVVLVGEETVSLEQELRKRFKVVYPEGKKSCALQAVARGLAAELLSDLGIMSYQEAFASQAIPVMKRFNVPKPQYGFGFEVPYVTSVTEKVSSASEHVTASPQQALFDLASL